MIGKSDLRFHDTMSRSIQPFSPISDIVTLYSCGPTVYHDAHIGNMRTYIFVDILKRVLWSAGYKVKHAMNITDVGHLVSDGDDGEDKMEVGAQREGLTAWQIANRYEHSFIEQCEALNIAAPTILCRATDHIAQQIAMIEALETRGYTYRTNDGIYFDTGKLDDYGVLGGHRRGGFKAGARVAEGQKRLPTDFALWKFSPEATQRQMEWPSPFGKGFPGWHIECSAMSQHYLGSSIDIHTGGIDHIAIHHSNEIAQSECATGCKPFVNYWMHGDFLEITDGSRMAKSSGDFTTVFSIKQKNIDPLAFRLMCFRSHYRKKMKFSWALLEDAATSLRRLRLRVASLIDSEISAPTDDVALVAKFRSNIEQSFADDLGIPRVIVALQDLLKSNEISARNKLAVIHDIDRVLQLDLLRDAFPSAVVTPDASAESWGEAARLGGHELGLLIRRNVHDHS